MPESGAEGAREARLRFTASLAASGLAEVVTLPIDTSKIRLQLQKTAGKGASSTPYTGMVNCMARIAREEGPRGLFKGLAPALLRQMSYTPIAMVVYNPIKNILSGGQEDIGFTQVGSTRGQGAHLRMKRVSGY